MHGQQNITFVCLLAAHWEFIDHLSFKVDLTDVSIFIVSFEWLLEKLVLLLLLLLLLTAIELSLGGSSPYTSTA
jgi:hypothetical protein